MSVNPGLHCVTGAENRTRINSMAAQLEALTATVNSLRQAVEDMRVREAWRAGAFAAGGALVGGMLGNLLKALGGV